MYAHRLIACIGALAVSLGALALPGRAGETGERERNGWPVVVRQTDDQNRQTEWSGAGPFLFGRVTEQGGHASGLRPLWIQSRDAKGQLRAGYFLYPLFSYTADETTYKWSVFELIRRTDRRKDAGGGGSPFDGRGELEIWPLWFSRQTGDPEMSYRAFFPIAGTIKNKLGFERATWRLFPLYFESEKRGTTTTSMPWPIVRVTRGKAEGFGVWPLYEKREQSGVWRHETYLWPLGFNSVRQPANDAPAGTPAKRDVGFLPFYSKHTGPGYTSENFGWPFFGYTDRTAPTRYHETRYFWPLAVQGRGDDKYVNRWGPFYTHSIVKGYDKRWYLWPVYRDAKWTEQGVERNKRTLLYFLFWSERQRKAGNPSAAPASLTHVWPLYSSWDNGAGRSQFQLFSPLEVFFPGNEKVRAAWSPLFAIARHEHGAPGVTRTSLLWNAITWRRNDALATREFHVGPLFSTSARADRRRVALGNGLLAFRREGASGWKMRWFDFPSRGATPPPAPVNPSR